MRFCLVYIVTLSNLAVLSSSITCENPFSASFLATVDHIVDQPPTVSAGDDPDLTYLKDVMKFNDVEIDLVIESAIKFFNDVYDLDFSLSTPNERFFENAKMSTFTFRDDVEYIVSINNWIRSGSTRSTCYRIGSGGFMVSFSANQTLYGSYGGVDGRPGRVGDFGFTTSLCVNKAL